MSDFIIHTDGLKHLMVEGALAGLESWGDSDGQSSELCERVLKIAQGTNGFVKKFLGIM